MSELEKKVCQAIEIIADKKVQELQFNKTIKATIIDCLDLATGEYSARYQDSIINCFSSDPQTLFYKNGTAVYISVPSNNLSERKVIQGTTNGDVLNSLSSTWNGSEVPTLYNSPAKDWDTDTELLFHVNDTYRNTSTNKLYTFSQNLDGTFEWTLLPDGVLVVEYSSTGNMNNEADWHSNYQIDDIYMRQRVGSEPWEGPIKVKGENGALGPYIEHIFAKNTSMTTAPTLVLDADLTVNANWSKEPLQISAGEYQWMSKARYSGDEVFIGPWSPPVRFSGEAGRSAVTLVSAATFTGIEITGGEMGIGIWPTNLKENDTWIVTNYPYTPTDTNRRAYLVLKDNPISSADLKPMTSGATNPDKVTINGNVLEAGTVLADAIAARTITVDKLNVGTNSNNILLDPLFKYYVDKIAAQAGDKSSLWDLAPTGVIKEASTTDTQFPNYLKITATGTDQQTWAKQSYDVVPPAGNIAGDIYLAKCWVKRGATPFTTGRMMIGGAVFTDKNGNTSYTSGKINLVDLTTTWTEYTYTFSVPANVYSMKTGRVGLIETPAPIGGVAYISGIQVYKKIPGDLTVNGTITADKIVAHVDIDSPTITGGLFRTGTSGSRVEISDANSDKITFYDAEGLNRNQIGSYDSGGGIDKLFYLDCGLDEPFSFDNERTYARTELTTNIFNTNPRARLIARSNENKRKSEITVGESYFNVSLLGIDPAAPYSYQMIRSQINDTEGRAETLLNGTIITQGPNHFGGDTTIYGGTTFGNDVAFVGQNTVTIEGTVSLTKSINPINNWTNFTPTSPFKIFNATFPAGYMKTSDGMVVLRGLVAKTSTGAIGDVIFTLPTGFRPSRAYYFAADARYGESNPRVGSIRVDEFGVIKLNPSYSGVGAPFISISDLAVDLSYISLDGISFYVG